LALFVQVDVAQLEIPVNNFFVVQVFHTLADLSHVLLNLLLRQLFLGSQQFIQTLMLEGVFKKQINALLVFKSLLEFNKMLMV